MTLCPHPILARYDLESQLNFCRDTDQGGEIMKRELHFAVKYIGASAFAVIVLSSLVIPQTVDVRAKPITDSDVQLLRQDVQAVKNQVITDTMSFNEKEAAEFWPVYKDYSAAQHSIADKRLALVTDYAQNLDKMDDSKARDLTTRMFAIEDETQTLRKTYFPRFEKALGAKRAAKFYQVDNRLTQMVNLQLASEVPLIP
jgi:Spy/CpxP family protein refolding chaperone